MKPIIIAFKLILLSSFFTTQIIYAAEAIIPIKVSTADLPQMQKKTFIRALVTYSKTDFFFYKGRPRGMQVEFLQQYENWLNQGIKREEKKTKIIYIPTTFDQLIPHLLAGKGDIAAAMLTITPARSEQVSFATGGKMSVNELLVSHKDAQPINKLEELSGKVIYVLKNSSYVEHLKQLNQQFQQQGINPIKIEQADSNLLSEDILELVNSGVRDYTIIDGYKGKLKFHQVRST